MAARKELLKAQAFVQQRLVAALVDREPDDPTPPLRRLGLGLFVSVLVAALVVAGFGIYGLIKKPKTTKWSEPNTIVVDTTAGITFVTPDGKKLHPVTNMASARLITGGDRIVTVTTASLSNVPRGEPYGIREAPAQLPDPGAMAPLPMRVCSLPAGTNARHTVLDFGAPAPSSTIMVALKNLAGDKYLVVDGVAHLVKPAAEKAIDVRMVLTPAADALIASLPSGAPLSPIVPEDKGNTVRGGRHIGDVVRVGDAGDEASQSYWLLLGSGWSQISYLDMRITYGGDAPFVPEAEVRQNISPDKPDSRTPGIPHRKVPGSEADTTRTTVCATYVPGSANPLVTVGTDVALTAAEKARQPAMTSYDRVTTTPGGGAMLRGEGTPAEGTSFLVWEGRKYGIPDTVSRVSLGYGTEPAVGVVNQRVLAMIPDGLPSGVALDREHANRPV